MTKGSALRRRRGIAAVATLAALACVAVLGLVAAQAAPPATGNALRKALPGPGESKLKDTTEFTGVEASKRFAIAVVRAKGGAVLAYVCDGKTIGRWLTGRAVDGRAVLTGRGGSTLTIVFGARNRSATGRIAGKSVTFRLQKAPKGTGLRRYLTRHPDSNVRIEAGWVITKQGPLYGVATSPDGKVVLNSNTDTNDTTGAGEATTPPGGDPVPTGLINRARCAVIVLKFSRAVLVSHQTGDFGPLNTQKQRFLDNDCAGEGFGLPPTGPAT